MRTGRPGQGPRGPRGRASGDGGHDFFRQRADLAMNALRSQPEKMVGPRRP